MQLNQLLLVFIVVILAANVAVVVVAADRGRGRAPRPDRLGRGPRESPRANVGEDAPRPSAASLAWLGPVPAPAPDPGEDRTGDDDARTAAAIEAFVAGVDRNVGGRGGGGVGPTAPGAAPRIDDAVESARSSDRVETAEPTDLADPVELADSIAIVDPVEFADPATWDRLLHEEAARVARFGRPVTVVFAECPDLDVVADRLGRVAADRVAAETARLLHAEGRATDRIARLGAAQFAMLLIETDEVEARRYVDRVRAVGDQWLESAGLSVRLTIGWASPGGDGDLDLAAATARERMEAANRRPVPRGQRGRRPSVQTGTAVDSRA